MWQVQISTDGGRTYGTRVGWDAIHTYRADAIKCRDWARSKAGWMARIARIDSEATRARAEEMRARAREEYDV
jgi:hypothetical protein